VIDKIYNQDCIEGMKSLPDNSIDCCVTSPPYFGLRDYGNDGQIGLEDTPEKFVQKLVEVFIEVKRVLKSEGTLWLNLGDSYAGGGGASGHTKETKNLGANVWCFAKRGKMFDKNGIQMLIPNKRFNFKPEKNSGAWFQTSWFCFGCGLSSDLNFVSLK